MDNIKKRRIDRRKRVTLPDDVMNKLNLSPGDYVAFEVNNGDVNLLKSFLYIRRKNGFS